MTKELKTLLDKAINNERYRDRYGKDLLDMVFKNPQNFTDTARYLEKNQARHLCSRCERMKSEKAFYSVKNNRIYPKGRLPICKKCINDLYFFFAEEYEDAYKAMRKICQLFDIYYDSDIVEACEWSDSIVGLYISKLNLRQNKKRNHYDLSEKEKVK